MVEKAVMVDGGFGGGKVMLIDFVSKGDKTYGIVRSGSKLYEVDIDKITIVNNI